MCCDAPARQLAAATAPRCWCRRPRSMPPDGASSPPIRLSSVVLPEPDGPISARKSPCGMSRLTPLQHVDALAAAGEVLVDVVDPDECAHERAPCSLGCGLNRCRYLTTIARRRPAPAAARRRRARRAVEPGGDFEAVAVGAAGLHGAALDRVLPHDEHVAGCRSRCGRRSSARASPACAAGAVGVVRLAQERHLHAHVGQDARIELLEADAHQHRGLLPIGRRHGRDDLAPESASRDTRRAPR